MRLANHALLLALMAYASPTDATDIGDVQPLVTDRIQEILPANGAGGAVVVIRINGRDLFFTYGPDEKVNKRSLTPDSLFNLASLGKVFDATLLGQAFERGELKFDDLVATYVTELKPDGYFGRVTIGQLATQTSGLLLPQDHPPWPEHGYTLPEFIRTLNAWQPDKGQAPGKQHTYTHAGFILLHLALERRFAMPMATLVKQRILDPLGMTSSTLPIGDKPRGELPAALRSRAVQGYADDGTPIGGPGDIQGYYHWPGTGQMFSSARDMARFLAANLGELPEAGLDAAIARAHRGAFPIEQRMVQALAWEINDNTEFTIIEKNGGLNNSSTYIGMIPSKRLGIVILLSRGNQFPAHPGRAILLALARGRG
jgi:beta-lactamase class C